MEDHRRCYISTPFASCICTNADKVGSSQNDAQFIFALYVSLWIESTCQISWGVCLPETMIWKYQVPCHIDLVFWEKVIMLSEWQNIINLTVLCAPSA